MPVGTTEELLVLGKITSVHGVRGEVKVHSFTEPLTNLLDYHAWILRRDDEVRRTELVSGRLQGKALVVKLKDLHNRELARDYAGFEICVPMAVLPTLDEGDYYWHQLQGLQVINQQDQLLGRIDHLLETGANDVMVIKPCVGSLDGRERLLPYTEQCIQDIRLAEGKVRVDWDVDF